MDFTTTTTTLLTSTAALGLNTTPPEVLTPDELDTVQRLKAAREGLYASYLWVVFFLGFPSNLACVVTVLSMTTLSTATLYVALLAVVDALTLLGKLVTQQIVYRQMYLGNAGCKATLLVNILNCYANWVLVMVCFERFLAVRWPLKKAVFFTKSRAWMVAAVLFAVIFFVNSHLFVFFISDPAGTRCGYSASFAAYMTVWLWFSSILSSIAPFVLLVVFTTYIILGLRKYRAARRSILNGERQHNGTTEPRRAVDHTANTERAISVMMTVAAVVFLLLTLPNCLYIIAYDHSASYPRVAKERWKLFEQVAYVLCDLNHAVNFYLYFLTADKFRTRFKQLVLCRRPTARKMNETTSLTDHTQYTRANSTENVHMSTRV